MLPAVVLVREQVALVVNTGANLREVGRAVLVPAMLVPAHELHPDRPTGCLRQERGSLLGIAIAASPESAGSFVILNPNLLGLHAEHVGQELASTVDILGRRHHVGA